MDAPLETIGSLASKSGLAHFLQAVQRQITSYGEIYMGVSKTVDLLGGGRVIIFSSFSNPLPYPFVITSYKQYIQNGRFNEKSMSRMYYGQQHINFFKTGPALPRVSSPRA